jgi:hypothetical protein
MAVRKLFKYIIIIIALLSFCACNADESTQNRTTVFDTSSNTNVFIDSHSQYTSSKSANITDINTTETTPDTSSMLSVDTESQPVSQETTLQITTDQSIIVEDNINIEDEIKAKIESQIDSDLVIRILDIENIDINFDGIEEIIVLTGFYPHNTIYCLSQIDDELRLIGNVFHMHMSEYINDLWDPDYEYIEYYNLEFFNVAYNNKNYVAFNYGSKSSYVVGNNIEILELDNEGVFRTKTLLYWGVSIDMSLERLRDAFYMTKDSDKFVEISKDEFDEIYQSLFSAQ